jgi:hypothetical protein
MVVVGVSPTTRHDLSSPTSTSIGCPMRKPPWSPGFQPYLVQQLLKKQADDVELLGKSNRVCHHLRFEPLK